jgi:hypothetical protein
MSADITPKNASKFSCEYCAFNASKHSDWNRHIMTAKHATRTLSNSLEQNKRQFNCKRCSKAYSVRNSLWYHEKKCTYIQPAVLPVFVPVSATLPTITKPINKSSTLFRSIPLPQLSTDLEAIPEDTKSLTLMVVELIKSNQELQKQMLDVCTKIQPITTNNVNTHSHNKTFNMQIFLNEQCKDAMNIMDFVDTFKLDYSDLEKVGEVGYVEGISNIIIQKLNEMDIYKRPIHCSDAKRETTFVKDKNVWEKENSNRDRLRLAIKHITKKNTDMLLSWCEAHPGSCDSDNYLNDVYIQIVRQAMGGGDIEENENKIMRKIARSVLIDKDL